MSDSVDLNSKYITDRVCHIQSRISVSIKIFDGDHDKDSYRSSCMTV